MINKERPEAQLRIGLAGFGNVGRALAEQLTAGAIGGVCLTAVTGHDLAKARKNAAHLTPQPKVVPLQVLPGCCDVVVECATAEAFPEIARTVLKAGKVLVVTSAAGILSVPDLTDLAVRNGGRVRVASGTLPGIDIIRSARENEIEKVRLTSYQMPGSLAHEPYIVSRGFDFSRPPPERVKVFEGTAREAATAFPRHFNVAVSLSLAGIGLDGTQVEIWCDPEISGAVVSVDLEGQAVSLSMTSRNRPSEANPRTSRIVTPSILAALRSMVDPVVVGS